jgi:FkbM family methyltransferase
VNWKETLKIFVRTQGYQVRKFPRSSFTALPVFDLCAQHLMRKENKSLFFLQIGANDGMQGDPLRRYITECGWRGILVEPQPDVFEKLKANYAPYADQLIFENVAINESDGSAELWRVCANTPDGGHALTLSSFNRSLVEKQRRELKGRMESIQVPCATPAQLLDKHGAVRLDVLQIDAEGYDYRILSLVDFSRWSPSLIQLEYGHLSRAEFDGAIALLEKQGYRMQLAGGDLIAFRGDGL